ncbi:EF-hand domain-containing protein [Alteromonas flava]|uniref:EF-hand domain-containing protein n=1 Tax=Alteromonas flava TaxID=2048003 RepID=UPI000F6033E4|nr:EF-hand domain-containing protein [Alteromonas flava]
MNKIQKFSTIIFSAMALQALATANVNAQESPELMALLDADQDGFISLKEAVGDANLLKNFGIIDTDEDGKISKDELSAADLTAAVKID